jgi:TatD DNase family protein
MLIDSHAHLLDPRFDADRDQVIMSALSSGISFIIESGCEENEWDKVIELCRSNNHVYCALGIHPHEAKTATDAAFAALEKKLGDPKAVAVGETGLDYFYKHSDPEVQKQVFLKHIDLAVKTGKPLVIHCRDAYVDMLPLLKSNSGRLRKPGLIHCFSGTPAEAKVLIGMGFLLGIDGPVTYPTARNLKDTVREIPLEKLVLETDCPYLPPQSYRGKRNEPAYLACVAEEIAMIKQVALETVEEVTTSNARELFSI